MMETATDRPVGVIQTDMFCPGCGYNLFTQEVVRDANLGILVCRCPECGKYSPAGLATDASARWKQAQASLVILIRVLVVLYLAVMALIGMAVLPYATAWELLSAATYGRGHGSPLEASEQLLMRLLFAGAAIGLGLAAAILMVIAFYHWRKWAYWLALVAPVLAGLGGAAFWHFEHPATAPDVMRAPQFADVQSGLAASDYTLLDLRQQWERASTARSPEAPKLLAAIREREAWLASRVARVELSAPAVHLAGSALLTMLGMALGIWIGRPLVRGTLRVLVSPQALQPAAMLWIVDAKAPPRPIREAARER
jgi:hypothetical protein